MRQSGVGAKNGGDIGAQGISRLLGAANCSIGYAVGAEPTVYAVEI